MKRPDSLTTKSERRKANSLARRLADIAYLVETPVTIGEDVHIDHATHLAAFAASHGPERRADVLSARPRRMRR
jgi:hypothetical protein